MDYLDDLIHNLYKHLIQLDGRNTNIIRKHTKKLQELGDVSFPLNIKNWRSLLPNIETSKTQSIFEYANTQEDLSKISASWKIRIKKNDIIGNNVCVYLDRNSTFPIIIKAVLDARDSYGASYLPQTKYHVSTDLETDKLLDVSELRVKLLSDVTKNFITFCGGTLSELEDKADVQLLFSLKSSKNKSTLCGAVLSSSGSKDKNTTAADFTNNHVTHMRLMAEHKYGLRITSQSGWKDFFEKLGHASVNLELLQNKPSSTLTINMNNPTVNNSKGSSFILYNCARLSTLFKEFDKRVASKIYPELPPIDEIDFSLLNQPEEWELLYVYIVQFPSIIKSCIRDISDRKLYPHHLVQHLSGLCLTFSIYYRRVRVLTEPREHLFAAIHAKIYFLKSLEQVLHTGLRLLNISPIRQM